MDDKNFSNCVTPECPYCPFCEYGYIVYPEDAYDIYCDCQWFCLYEPNESENKDKSGGQADLYTNSNERS